MGCQGAREVGRPLGQPQQALMWHWDTEVDGLGAGAQRERRKASPRDSSLRGAVGG